MPIFKKKDPRLNEIYSLLNEFGDETVVSYLRKIVDTDIINTPFTIGMSPYEIALSANSALLSYAGLMEKIDFDEYLLKFENTYAKWIHMGYVNAGTIPSTIDGLIKAAHKKGGSDTAEKYNLYGMAKGNRYFDPNISGYRIRNCSYGFRCDQEWELLKDKGQGNKKLCEKCGSYVYLCNDEISLMYHVFVDNCVAFDTTVIMKPDSVITDKLKERIEKEEKLNRRGPIDDPGPNYKGPHKFP